MFKNELKEKLAAVLPKKKPTNESKLRSNNSLQIAPTPTPVSLKRTGGKGKLTTAQEILAAPRKK